MPHILEPERLGGPVAGVDEVRGAAAGLLARLEGRVVPQVRGDIDVGAAGPHRVELVIPGAAEHRYARDPSKSGKVPMLVRLAG